MAKLFLSRRNITESMSDLYRVDEDVAFVGCHVFRLPLLVIRDPELIKSLLVKNFDHFADHYPIIGDNDEPVFSKNLVALRGDRWKEVRAVLSLAFTASKMRTMHGLVTECAKRFVSSFVELNLAADNVDTKDAFGRYANDVIASCVFGVELDSLEDPGGPAHTPSRPSLLILLALVLVPKVARRLGLRIIPKAATDFFVRVVADAMEQRRRTGSTRPDVFRLLMDHQAQKENMDQLLAANRASAAEAEIDVARAEHGDEPGYDVLGNLACLDAVVAETLRMRPNPLIERMCTKDFELPPSKPDAKPFVVRARKAAIVVPLPSLHRDIGYYDEPDKFLPERFVGKKAYAKDPTALGFGLGPRMCLGMRFTLLETKVMLFHLLAKCELLPAPKTPVPLVYDTKIALPSSRGGFWIKFTSRNSSA